jgi:hypothetical protein
MMYTYQPNQKMTKLRCEVGHMEFVEMNISMQSRAN